MSITLVTGASRGIGAAIARIAAARKRDLVLVARSEGELETLAAELRADHGVSVRILPADLSVEGEAARVWTEAGKVTCLVNNAGLGSNGPVTSRETGAREDTSVRVNLLAATVLLKAAVTEMPGRGGGKVLNVASLSGFFPGPGMAVYHATKAYLLSLSEAASQEAKGTGVSVTALCPGPTESGFFAAAGMGSIPLLKMSRQPTAHDVAMRGWKGMEAGRRVVVPGLGNKLVAAASHVTPHAILLPLTHALMSRR